MIACGFTLVNIPVPMKTAPHLKGAVPFKGSISMITIFVGSLMSAENILIKPGGFECLCKKRGKQASANNGNQGIDGGGNHLRRRGNNRCGKSASGKHQGYDAFADIQQKIGGTSTDGANNVKQDFFSNMLAMGGNYPADKGHQKEID